MYACVQGQTIFKVATFTNFLYIMHSSVTEAKKDWREGGKEEEWKKGRKDWMDGGKEEGSEDGRKEGKPFSCFYLAVVVLDVLLIFLQSLLNRTQLTNHQTEETNSNKITKSTTTFVMCTR